ncbi:DUF2064 domain-containing protein [Nocardioides sp. CFH 31398]|uniref:TIGR04282 family arsenosugar biosynthesis glycosyltransferase n=1 Tax=Nocardioides sp. CFH 31398 TaxID=2919579 RepID=UPI001F0614C9|nr:DUF2064 domain-containing protein [Nocardioides sp. CFH 31398]MCH1867500.1 DUF2064 domain-containing protein [Nocardioides sp. CFH 31398]
MTTQDGLSPAHALVLAKAPVAGAVKTRLGADIGLDEAAEAAAAALLDTLRACTDAFGADRCHLALAGDLAEAVRGEELTAAIDGWHVAPQRGDGLGERIAAAHEDAARAMAQRGTGGTTVQIGMDTPQVTGAALRAAADALGSADAALGPAEDGGWWVLALRDPAGAGLLAPVPMSTPTTYDDTHAALVAGGLTVADLPVLRDVDTVADAEAVVGLAPDGEFARAWTGLVARAGTRDVGVDVGATR